MKKILMLALFFLLWLFTTTSVAGWVTMFGSNQYVRTTGAPNVYSDTFSATSREGVLRIKNGDQDGGHRLSSVKIFINGEQIFGPSDFNQQVYLLENPVSLTETNSIEVELRSKPGSYLSIEIMQFIEPPIVTIAADPLTIHTGESSTLTWTFTSADSVSIDQGIGSVDSDGSISVLPSETTTYIITAVNLGGTATADATVTFLNTAPVAMPQSVETDEDTSLAIILSGSDIDDDPLTYQVVSEPSQGTLSGTTPDLMYTPNPNYNGLDTFTFTTNDGIEDSTPATINITVNPVNDAPVANNQAVATNEDTSIAITLTGSDVDGDALTFQITAAPSSGTLTGTPPNLTYTPNSNYNGPDSFTFKVTDGQIESNIATIGMTVMPVNDPPVAADDAYTTEEDQAITTANVLANDTDVDEDDLNISGFTQPANGTVISHGDGTFTFTPNSGFSGTDSFNYTVSDGHGGSDTGTVTVQVIPGSLEVAITSPAEGAQFTTDNITVTGTVSRSSASVFVNGVAATINGNEFTAENVPLVPGANTISVLVEDGTHTAVASITVMRLTDMDLEPVQIEITSISEDDESLKISGQATVTVANNGSSDVTTPYTIVLFEDTNVSGSYEETEDNLLGEIRVPEGSGAGEAMNVSIEFVGELLFRDNRIHVFVDSAGELEESNEDNNVIATQTTGVDLSASLLRLDDDACPESIQLTVRMGNAGATTISQGISVAFYDGDPESGGILIGTVLSTQTLEPGRYEDLSLQWTAPPTGTRSIYAIVDDDGAVSGTLDEPNEENNRIFSEMDLCPPLPPTDGISGQVIDAVTGAFLAGVTVSLHADNNGSPGTLIDQLTSDDDGYFVFSGLNAGGYVLVAASQGYITAHRQAVLVSGETLTNQDLVLSPVLNADEIRIVLTWGAQPADLEGHLTAPNPDGCRFHCFYWNKEIAGARLDLDDSDSYGPETITITQKSPGTYRFYVHDFTNRLSLSSNALSASGAKVTVYSGASGEPVTFTVPSGSGTVWHVFNLDGESGEITPIEKMTHQNHPGRIDFPKITSTPVTRVAYGETYTYQVTATDPDLDTLAYSLIRSPAGMTLDPFTGLIEWTPTGGQGRRHDVEVRVNDGRCGEDIQSFEIDVSYLPPVQFSVEPCSGMNPGGDITLTWQTARADTVIIDQGIGEVAASGSLTLPSPSQPIAFTLTAENNAGQIQKIIPASPSINLFDATCVTSEGDASILTWQSECAAICEIDQGIGIVPTSGSITVGPSDLPFNYTLTCTNGAESRSATTAVARCPLTPQIDITANPNCEWSFYGHPITLTWSISGIDVQSCEIQPDIGSVPAAGSIIVTPTEPTRYTLICTTSNGGVVSKSADPLDKLNITHLSADPRYIDAGETTNLIWRTSCATSASFDQGIGDVGINGSMAVTPADLPIIYTLTATNERESRTRSVTIGPHPPTATFSVSPSVIKAGESAVLSWTTDNATSCNITPDIGEVALNGTINVQPEQSTRYTLTAIGPGGTITKTATVTYIQPVVEIHADPEVLDEGETTTLTWVFSNADTCIINQGIVEVQLGGNITVDPIGTTTYTITATGPGGTATDSVTVTCLQPTVTINADPESILEGASTSLSWHADHAATCVIEPGIGTVDLDGSVDVSPAITTTYTATASGRGGEVSAQATVTVINPASISLIEPDGNEDKAHKSFTIQWTDRDYDSDATIALFYDINNSGADGTLITAGISENPDGQYDQYVWDTTNIPAGAYYVYAVIEDGVNDPVVAYSDGAVIIDHAVTDEFKITASDGEASDYFGSSVSIDGDYAVVGTHSADEGGVVYIFKQEGPTWVEQFKLTASDGAPSDNFGESVSISGDTVVVGAPAANESNGAAYVFKRDGATWTEQAKLIAQDGSEWYAFGASVSISGDTVVVGAPYYGGNHLGAAYVFTCDGSLWTEQAKLTTIEEVLEDGFGRSVSIDGNTIIVGAPSAENNIGASYIFSRNDSEWVQQGKLTPGDATGWDQFGGAVSINSDTAIVGAIGDIDLGRIYAFKQNNSIWVEQIKLTASDGDFSDYFGSAISIYANYIVVGAPYIDDYSGAVYIFKQNGDPWSESAKLTASDGDSSDHFGYAVGLSDNYIIVGASGDDDKGNSSGSAYIYPLFSVSISADPEIIHIGGEGSSSLLSWTSRDADSVRIDPDIGPVSESGLLTVSPQQTTTYTITATKDGVTVNDSVTVSVIDSSVLPTVEISATPETIVRGASAALSWSATNVETVTLDNGTGEAPMTGTTPVSPIVTTTYTVTATNESGTATASVTITVTEPPPTVTIAADPGTIPAGEATFLTWTSSNADAVSIEPGIGGVDPNGSVSVSPMETTTYVITALGPGGTATAEVTVTVTDPLPIVELSAEPTDINAGEIVTLTWTTTHADSASIEPDIGPVDLNGTLPVTPMQTTTYTLTATGSGGTKIADVTVTVYNPVTLQITSPLDGTNVSGTTLSVKGTVAHAGDNETGVTVNGIVAMISGNQFTVNHVPLNHGENIITARATDAAGVTMTDSITVNADTSGDSIRLTADPGSGMAPLETTLKIDGSFDFTSSNISYVGPDTVEFLESSHDEYRVAMTTEGVYTFTVQVEDYQGYTYTSTVAVEVVDEAALDGLLQDKWAGMKAALVAGDVDGALEYHYEDTQERYAAIYNALGSDLPMLSQQMQEISPIYFEDQRAKYRIRQDHSVEGQTVTITYYIYFSQDENGIWKIEKY